ncbi:MAG TPA: Asp-tRNA(Asn)/Glu-tRNA(Gln) amidotransferase subunit GatC [Longimicrobiaceae bacterium]|nr:Asp-tRNA(Asn)/Glu-tRNA(Gln) amidotransferase subunit GatC [Longimicrobiaceae bacterium]
MPISLDEVHRLAAESRLALKPHEATALRAELEGMLQAFDALPPADGDPAVAVPGLECARMRSDLGAPDTLLLPPSALAPAWAGDLFVVPRLESHAAAPPSAAAVGSVDGEPARVTGRPGRAGSRG